jgi:hypothetical protein
LLHSIPGYTGYKDKERRRDADKQVRDKVAAALSTQADRVDEVAQTLATQRQLTAIGPVDDLSKLLRHLIDRIAHATYGYGGLFSNRPIDERALDQIRAFDESLFESVASLSNPIGSLEQAAAAKQDLGAPTSAVDAAARQLSAQIDLRGQIIETGEPAPQDQVDAALQVLKSPDQQASEKAPPPAYDLHEKDALAIMGDNFLVDSRIEVDSASASFRLFRVDTAPNRWLFVPSNKGSNYALLTESADDFTEQPLAIGGKPYVNDASGSGTSQIAGAGGSSNSINVHFWLLKSADGGAGRAVVLTWSGQRQVYAGDEVHPDDVEIFGAAAKN